jgi:hypothetical protein
VELIHRQCYAPAYVTSCGVTDLEQEDRYERILRDVAEFWPPVCILIYIFFEEPC